MPNLVGEIIAGVVVGPGLLDFVPNPTAFVMLGEIGLILLVIEAGIDIDLTTIKLIGARGVSIAIMGSILPIMIGIGIAFALGTDAKGSIAAGCCFGPTSLGIAMNILRSAKIINTPIGQMIVAAAVIDDMIALIILSELKALVGTITVASVLIPIVSALGFLCIGGVIAVFVWPKYFDQWVLSRLPQPRKGPFSLGALFAWVIVLMPATYYAQASYLMGSFVAGLGFCTNHDAHVHFVSQFKRVMQWLMRIFFAASIGFQVPIKHFANGTVIWQGLVFLFALLGKIAVGFMVPNFTNNRRFTNLHLRDCLIVSFSMAAEGEFAFVIAVFSVDNLLIGQDLYASIVLAILLSTIISPFALRMTIAHYNKVTEKAIEAAEEVELKRNMSLINQDDIEALHAETISKSTVFVIIQIHCDSGWGLLPRIMQTLGKLNLDIIDHRTWNPRGVNSTMVNEIYAKDTIAIRQLDEEAADQAVQDRIDKIQKELMENAIKQKNAKVKVHRWFPGVIEEIVEEVCDLDDGTTMTTTRKLVNLKEEIADEASKLLEEKKEKQMNFTEAKTVEEIIKESEAGVTDAGPDKAKDTTPALVGTVKGNGAVTATARPQRRLTKTRSTPVVGGDLFATDEPCVPLPTNSISSLTGSGQLGVISEDQPIEIKKTEHTVAPGKPARRIMRIKSKSTSTGGVLFGGNGKDDPNGRDITLDLSGPLFKDKKSTPSKETEAQLLVDGRVYKIIVKEGTLSRIKEDARGQRAAAGAVHPARLNNNDIRYRREKQKVGLDEMLEGFVRKDSKKTF